MRNVIVHEYQDLDLDIVATVVREHLSDLSDFSPDDGRPVRTERP